MAVKSKLKKALSAIDDAKRALRRAEQVNEASNDARRARRDLEGAEAQIKKAIREYNSSSLS